MWGENDEVVDGLTAGGLGPHLVRSLHNNTIVIDKNVHHPGASGRKGVLITLIKMRRFMPQKR